MGFPQVIFKILMLQSGVDNCYFSWGSKYMGLGVYVMPTLYYITVPPLLRGDCSSFIPTLSTFKTYLVWGFLPDDLKFPSLSSLAVQEIKKPSHPSLSPASAPPSCFSYRLVDNPSVNSCRAIC